MPVEVITAVSPENTRPSTWSMPVADHKHEVQRSWVPTKSEYDRTKAEFSTRLDALSDSNKEIREEIIPELTRDLQKDLDATRSEVDAKADKMDVGAITKMLQDTGWLEETFDKLSQSHIGRIDAKAKEFHQQLKVSLDKAETEINASLDRGIEAAHHAATGFLPDLAEAAACVTWNS